jgi:hypothetical protein
MAFDYGLEHGISCHCHKYVESLLIELKKKIDQSSTLAESVSGTAERNT